MMMPCAIVLGGPGFFALREAMFLPFALADRTDAPPATRSDISGIAGAAHALGTAGAVLGTLTGVGLLPVALIGVLWFAFALMPLPAWTVLPALALVGAGNGNPPVLGAATGAWSDGFVYSSQVVDVASFANASLALAPFAMGRGTASAGPGRGLLTREPAARSLFWRLQGLAGDTGSAGGLVSPDSGATFPAALRDANGSVVAFLVGGEGALIEADWLARSVAQVSGGRAGGSEEPCSAAARCFHVTSAWLAALGGPSAAWNHPGLQDARAARWRRDIVSLRAAMRERDGSAPHETRGAESTLLVAVRSPRAVIAAWQDAGTVALRWTAAGVITSAILSMACGLLTVCMVARRPSL